MTISSNTASSNGIYKYVAGLIDGDGTITISKISKNKKYRAIIKVYNCNPKIISILNNAIKNAPIIINPSKKEGSVRIRKYSKKINPHWRNCITWSVGDNKAYYLLKKILPFLYLKKKQALLLLKFKNIRDQFSSAQRRWNIKLNNKIKIKLEKIKNKCNILNERGSINNTKFPILNKKLYYEYIAGFIDAEGHIGITKAGSLGYRIKVSISNTNINIMKYLSNTFSNGYLYKKKNNNPKWKDAYELSLTCQNAINFLKKIAPFLILKREQADLLFEWDIFSKTFNPAQLRWDKKLNKKIVNRKKELHKKSLKLNKRGR